MDELCLNISRGVFDTLCSSAVLDESMSVIILLAFLLGLEYIRRWKCLTNTKYGYGAMN